MDLIQMYWPTATHGQALITTRNTSMAFSLADTGLEITTWDTDTGSRFLLHLLSSEYEHDTIPARKLCNKLGGHAMALSYMAGLIQRYSYTISELLYIYNKSPAVMHGFSNNNSIRAL